MNRTLLLSGTSLLLASIGCSAEGTSTDEDAITQETNEALSRNDRRVVALDDTYRRHTYPEWAAKWWQWALSLTEAQHPLFDRADCSSGQTGNVWFVGASATHEPVIHRTCSIPKGTALAFRGGFECSTANTDNSGDLTEAGLRLCASAVFPALTAELEIDGTPVGGATDFHVETPLFAFNAPNPPGLFGLTPAQVYGAAGNGITIIVKPLSVGHHQIVWRQTMNEFNDPSKTVVQVATYDLTVTCQRANADDPDS